MEGLTGLHVGDVVGCGVILRKISLEEAIDKELQDRNKRAQAKARQDLTYLSMIIGRKVEHPPDEDKQEQTSAEPEEHVSPQERVHFLLDCDETNRAQEKSKSLVS